MLDTNVFDEMISDEFFPDIEACIGKYFQFLSTPIQEEEIANIPGARYRRLINALPRTVVPFVKEEGPKVQEKHQKDLGIVLSAIENAAVLLSNDQGLQSFAKKHYPELEVWNYQEFVSFCLREGYFE